MSVAMNEGTGLDGAFSQEKLRAISAWYYAPKKNDGCDGLYEGVRDTQSFPILA